MKFSYVTSFSELLRWWHQFGQFCIEFRAVAKRFETPQNISFGSNGVDQIRLANLCVNVAISKYFDATSFSELMR
jgi:hypothetical protein